MDAGSGPAIGASLAMETTSQEAKVIPEDNRQFAAGNVFTFTIMADSRSRLRLDRLTSSSSSSSTDHMEQEESGVEVEEQGGRDTFSSPVCGVDGPDVMINNEGSCQYSDGGWELSPLGEEEGDSSTGIDEWDITPLDTTNETKLGGNRNEFSSNTQETKSPEKDSSEDTSVPSVSEDDTTQSDTFMVVNPVDTDLSTSPRTTTVLPKKEEGVPEQEEDMGSQSMPEGLRGALTTSDDQLQPDVSMSSDDNLDRSQSSPEFFITSPRKHRVVGVLVMTGYRRPPSADGDVSSGADSDGSCDIFPPREVPFVVPASGEEEDNPNVTSSTKRPLSVASQSKSAEKEEEIQEDEDGNGDANGEDTGDEDGSNHLQIYLDLQSSRRTSESSSRRESIFFASPRGRTSESSGEDTSTAPEVEDEEDMLTMTQTEDQIFPLPPGWNDLRTSVLMGQWRKPTPLACQEVTVLEGPEEQQASETDSEETSLSRGKGTMSTRTGTSRGASSVPDSDVTHKVILQSSDNQNAERECGSELSTSENPEDPLHDDQEPTSDSTENLQAFRTPILLPIITENPASKLHVTHFTYDRVTSDLAEPEKAISVEMMEDHRLSLIHEALPMHQDSSDKKSTEMVQTRITPRGNAAEMDATKVPVGETIPSSVSENTGINLSVDLQTPAKDMVLVEQDTPRHMGETEGPPTPAASKAVQTPDPKSDSSSLSFTDTEDNDESLKEESESDDAGKESATANAIFLSLTETLPESRILVSSSDRDVLEPTEGIDENMSEEKEYYDQSLAETLYESRILVSVSDRDVSESTEGTGEKRYEEREYGDVGRDVLEPTKGTGGKMSEEREYYDQPLTETLPESTTLASPSDPDALEPTERADDFRSEGIECYKTLPESGTVSFSGGMLDGFTREENTAASDGAGKDTNDQHFPSTPMEHQDSDQSETDSESENESEITGETVVKEERNCLGDCRRAAECEAKLSPLTERLPESHIFGVTSYIDGLEPRKVNHIRLESRETSLDVDRQITERDVDNDSLPRSGSLSESQIIDSPSGIDDSRSETFINHNTVEYETSRVPAVDTPSPGTDSVREISHVAIVGGEQQSPNHTSTAIPVGERGFLTASVCHGNITNPTEQESLWRLGENGSCPATTASVMSVNDNYHTERNNLSPRQEDNVIPKHTCGKSESFIHQQRANDHSSLGRGTGELSDTIGIVPPLSENRMNAPIPFKKDLNRDDDEQINYSGAFGDDTGGEDEGDGNRSFIEREGQGQFHHKDHYQSQGQSDEDIDLSNLEEIHEEETYLYPAYLPARTRAVPPRHLSGTHVHRRILVYQWSGMR